MNGTRGLRFLVQYPLSERWRAHALVVALFVVLAFGLSYPLPLRFTTHTPGTATWAFDESTFLWNIWYFKHALLNLGTSPLHSELIWYPLGIDLILHTYNFFNALLAFPLQLAWGLVPASNSTLIFATALSGYGAYLLARQLLRDWHLLPSGSVGHLPPLLAGLIYAFGSNRAVYLALGHYDMVTTGCIPLYALYLVRSLRASGPMRRSDWHNATMAGLFFALAALAEMIFAVFLALLTLIFAITALQFSSASHWPFVLRLTSVLKRLAVIALVAALLWGPVFIPIVREFISGDYALEGWGEGLKLSTDLLGFITPTALHPIWGENWQRALRAVEEGTARFSDVNTVFIGWVTLALALIGALVSGWRGRPWRWTALLFGLFCLGPLLQINGRYEFSLDRLLGERGVTFPMPFALLHYIPFVKANRAPNRNSVVLMLGIAVLAALAVAWITTARRQNALLARGMRRIGNLLSVVLAVAILFEHAAIPMPLTDARVPAIYRQIAAEPDEFAILQLPLGWRNSFGVFGSEWTQVQFYQTVHGKPMLGGNISRAPSFKMEYFRRLPLFQAIAEVEFGQPVSPEVDAAARAQAAELMYLYDVRYLVILPPIPGRYPYIDTYAATREYVLSLLPVEPKPFYDEGGVQAYRILQPAGRADFELDLGTGHSAAYRGEGWHEDEQPFGTTATWAGARQVRLFLPVRVQSPSPAYRLSLRVHPFAYPGAPIQRVQAFVNGRPLGEPAPLEAGWSVVQFDVPAGAVRDGLNRITLAFDWTARPRDVLPADARIGQTGVETPVDIEINATAEFAYITLEDDRGARVDGSAGRRGYNVAVINPHSGRLLERRGFDTAANAYEAERLAQFLQEIPEGLIVVAATRGPGTAHLTDQAWAALQEIGAGQDPRGIPGVSHAIIGVKGALPGSAVEVVRTGGAYLRIGRNPDRRSLAAAVDWVRLEPTQTR
ncbi:MAG: interleukin-like EMT inducer domain-containing protein [Anaerolineae bacterium]|nr:hypothetical protein [Anaerolineae bacterium]MDW8098917.1 interleukin-like EMT inducer domain-containing protein [Anaerolineae bacterium]